MRPRPFAIAVVVLAVIGLSASVVAFVTAPAGPSTPPPSTTSRPSVPPLGARIQVRPIASASAAAHDPIAHPLPLAESPQRRVWWAGGRWWAVLPDPASSGWALLAGSAPTGPWTPQGLVDDRRRVRIDVAVSGDDLLIAAAGAGGARDALRASRYVLDGGRYRLLPDSPFEVVGTGVRALSAAFDANGDPWLAYVVDDRLAVSRGLDGGTSWETAPDFSDEAARRVPTVVALVSTDDHVAVAWTEAESDRLWVERFSASGWLESTVELGGLATGRLSAVAVPGRAGQVLVAAALRAQGGGQSAGIVLARVPTTGEPTISLVARTADRLANPVLTLVPDASVAVVLATAPTPAGGSVIVAKAAHLDSLSFATGQGDVVLEGAGASLVGEAMAPAFASSGSELTVVAADRGGAAILAGLFGIDDGVPPPRAEPLAPPRSFELVRQSFDAQPVGATPSGWTLRNAERVGSVSIVEEPSAGRFARLSGTSTGPVRTCLQFRAVPSGHVLISTSIRLGALGVGDAWLAVRGRGDATTIRFDDDRSLAYRNGTTKTWTGATFESGRWYHWSAAVDIAAGQYSWTLKDNSGGIVAAALDVPWSAAAADPLDLVCVEVPAGPDAPSLDFDDVEVDHVLADPPP